MLYSGEVSPEDKNMLALFMKGVTESDLNQRIQNEVARVKNEYLSNPKKVISESPELAIAIAG